MAKMNSIDQLARDVAFEIILGGDRFDPKDVAENLDGISSGELDIFKKRIAYHAVDFAPPEYRTDEFVSRMTKAWTSGIRLGDSPEIHQAFLEAAQNMDRGKWFRFANGEFKRCDRAVVEAMWREKDRTMMDPKPVEPFVVARVKADQLIEKYGREVMYDHPYDVVEIDSYGMTAAGHIMTVRRNVDILASKVEDHQYYVAIKTPNGGTVTALSAYTPDEANDFIDLIDSERSLRESAGIMDDFALSDSAIVGLPKDTIVFAPDSFSPSGVSRFRATSVFFGPDGSAMVSGRFVGDPKGEAERNFQLGELSDKSVAIIKQATDVAMKNILSKMASLETDGLKNDTPRRKTSGNTL